ncbi:ferredoxin [Flavobacterium rakeshii]|uniref:ferredoxin n=1 Tax=Flavobacterium rakeshii TaxID=1038845 RepID=UPI002E7BF1D4|nr:ferredoxin [Flavobacterium rakeshii]MEE1899441.1 ferredoxin [Flavobacterium rakeshii]
MKNEIIITVKDLKGKHHILHCPTDMGFTLKDMCVAYELPMEAVCGGMAMCATCHCYILNDIIGIPQKNDAETALLSEVITTTANSRLTCQIPLTNEMNGLYIEIASE